MAHQPEFLLDTHRVRPALDEINDQRVEPKTMAVLLALVEAAPDPLTSQELLDQVWPGTVVVDNVVHKTIARLRQALGDNAREPIYIETIPRRGYRLMVNVQSAESTRSEQSVYLNPVPVEEKVGLSRPSGMRERSWHKLALVFTCGLLFVSGFYFVSAERTKTAQSPGVIAVAPLRDLSAAQNLDWLTEGLTEEIRRQIASWNRYEVLHRLHSASGASALLELKADLLLDGYLQASDDGIVLVLSVVELPSGKTLWQDEFSGDPSDPLAMQTRIAANVARHFNESTPASPALKNPIAYQAYLKSLHFEFLHDTRKEIYWIEKALALEPEWTQGWQRLVIAYSIVYHSEFDSEAGRQATAAFEKLDDSLSNLFFLIYHTAYIQDDFDRAETIIQSWIDLEYRGEQGPGPFAPYAVFSYARLLQESGLYQSAANALVHVTEAVPYDPAGWEALTLNLIKLRDYAGAKVAATRYAELVPTSAGARAERYLLHIAALQGDAAGVAEMLEESEVDGGFRHGFVRFNLAMSQNDEAAARRELELLSANGWHRSAAYGYLRLDDEQAAMTEFSNAKLYDPTGMFIHAFSTLTMDPADSRHPLVLDWESHMGIPVGWRSELCKRASGMPRESYIDCTLNSSEGNLVVGSE